MSGVEERPSSSESDRVESNELHPPSLPLSAVAYFLRRWLPSNAPSPPSRRPSSLRRRRQSASERSPSSQTRMTTTATTTPTSTLTVGPRPPHPPQPLQPVARGFRGLPASRSDRKMPDVRLQLGFRLTESRQFGPLALPRQTRPSSPPPTGSALVDHLVWELSQSSLSSAAPSARSLAGSVGSTCQIRRAVGSRRTCAFR